MRSSLIIDNYNYAQYLKQAIESARAQTLPFDEIIFVDDGSTDASLECIQGLIPGSPPLQLIRKSNGGQLSAFVEGIHAATGDLLFFLDSDDVFTPDHHESLRHCFTSSPSTGLAFSAHQTFGRESALHTSSFGEGSLGLTVIPTYAECAFIGNITSALAIRKSIVESFLPVMQRMAPLWRSRADDCLVLGASLAGAIKFSSNKPTVQYRLHDKNLFAQVAGSSNDDYRHFLRRRGYVTSVAAHLGLDDSIIEWADVEYLSSPRRGQSLKASYSRIILGSRLPLHQKIKKLLKIHLSKAT